MNIFLLSLCPIEAARMQCDKHVVKMIVESAQMLSTIVGGQYKPTHRDHPCTVWAGKSVENFEWLVAHGLALCDEYTFRYGRRHKTQDVLEHISLLPDTYIKPLGKIGLTPFALAMPDEFKTEDPVESYRAYYHSKASFAKWTRRKPPIWWNPK